MAIRLMILLGGAMLAMAAEETHAGGEHLIWGLSETMWKWINFAFLAAGLGYVAVKVGGPALRERAAAILNGINEGKRVKAESDAKVAEMEAKIANLGTEVARIREDAKKEAANEAQRIQRETVELIAKIQAQGEAEIERTMVIAKHELSAHAARLAVDIASARLRGELAGDRNRDLVETFIRDLENTKN